VWRRKVYLTLIWSVIDHWQVKKIVTFFGNKNWHFCVKSLFSFILIWNVFEKKKSFFWQDGNEGPRRRVIETGMSCLWNRRLIYNERPSFFVLLRLSLRETRETNKLHIFGSLLKSFKWSIMHHFLGLEN